MTRHEIELKLADYAVGEVTEAERAEIEAALARDAGLRAQLEEIRESLAFISAAAPSGGVKLSAARREALMTAAVKAARPAGGGRGRWIWPVSLAASALIAFGAGLVTGDRLPARRADGGAVASRGHAAPGLMAPEEPQGSGSTIVPVTVAGDPVARAPMSKSVEEFERRKVDHGLALKESARGGRYNRKGVPAFPGPRAELAAGDVDGADFFVPDDGEFNREEYARIFDNPFRRVTEEALSTFSIDVDTASYANARRFLTGGQLPPPDAVRIEEMVNYFRYAYRAPQGDAPFSVALEMQPAPWEPKHRLVRIGLQGREISVAKAPAANLVFLLDVSGSMNEPAKLPLVKEALKLLVENLREEDRVAMVVYAGSSGLVLPSTSGARKEEIVGALDRLAAGGSTNGGAGIQLAYQVAADNFVKGGVNRVILCTDGDFNVGVSSEGDLTRLIEEKRKTGVFLSVLGFGAGNYADARMQSLADKGNGNAAYIDTVKEARKVLVEQATGTLITIAKDVKIQVEFNPAKVAGYRLIGYENRMLAAQDFKDDARDAGEIGAGHQVTALYEIIPAGQDMAGAKVDELKYQRPPQPDAGAFADEWLTVKLRYKRPDGDVSVAAPEAVLKDMAAVEASDDFEFAAAVAMAGMLLRDSPHKGQSNWNLAVELAAGGLAADPGGYRAEFVELLKKARELAPKK